MNNASAHWWNGDHDTTKFPLYYATTAKTSYAAEIDSFFAEVVFTQRRLQGSLPEPRRLRQQGQRRRSTGMTQHRHRADQGQARSGAAARLHDARRVLELVRALRRRRRRSCAARSSSIYMIGVNPGPPTPRRDDDPAAGRQLHDRARAGPTRSSISRRAAWAATPTSSTRPATCMENYDAIGTWQTVDKLGTGPINPVADRQLRRRQHEADSQRPGADDELAEHPKGQAMYAQNWVSFAYGRDPNPNDQCVADQHRHQAGRKTARFSTCSPI